MIICRLLLLIFIKSSLIISTREKNPEVQISQGILRGKYLTSRNGRTINAFTGIPYAKPPIGKLRFEPPLPAEPWEGILNASKPHAICPQSNLLSGDFSVSGDEDCLYLNVYTPQLPKLKTEHLPVMFFIHGGAFLLGSASEDIYGPQILLDKDIVLVVANYRLGPLGFLTTGDQVVPGNNGLKDQVLAIKWVKQNIASFGGNPGRITLFGQSAGGASSHFHMLSPLSKDLISGVIALSGTALSVWALSQNDEATENSKKLAEILDCPSNSSLEMVKCLKEVDVKKLVGQEEQFLLWNLDPMIPFKPVIEPKTARDDAFLPAHPIDIIKSGNVAKIPFITGLTTEDGAMKSPGVYGKPNMIEELDTDFNRVAPITLLYHNTAPNPDYVSKLIRDFYFGDKEINNYTVANVTNMFTDSMFFAAEDQTVRLHFKYLDQPVYYYLFGYRGSASFAPIFGDATRDYGVCHSDDLFYIFSLGELFSHHTPSDLDQMMSEMMTTLWTNFAKTGDPTPETHSKAAVKWNPIESDNLEYYFIQNSSNVKMSRNMFLDRAVFWRSLPINSRRNHKRFENLYQTGPKLLKTGNCGMLDCKLEMYT